jgi:hypothetical protein
MSKIDSGTERSTEQEVEAASAGVKTFATPGEQVRIIPEVVPADPEEGRALVGLSIRSDKIEGRLFLEIESAEDLAAAITTTAEAARDDRPE